MEARDGRLVWQLSRLIAGTRLGPKRRQYNAFTAVPPNIRDWDLHMSLPGPDGGMEAVVLSKGTAADSHPVVEWARMFSHDLVQRYRQYADLCSGRTDKPEKQFPSAPSSSRVVAPLPQVTFQARQACDEDFRGLVRRLLNSKARRAVPEWSAPRELWILALAAPLSLVDGPNERLGAFVSLF
eukprot:8369847-Pyramimonas_sp.AAC.1